MCTNKSNKLKANRELKKARVNLKKQLHSGKQVQDKCLKNVWNLRQTSQGNKHRETQSIETISKTEEEEHRDRTTDS